MHGVVPPQLKDPALALGKKMFYP